MIYTEININTFDSEFSGRSFKGELFKELNNVRDIFKEKIKHLDADLHNLIGELSGCELIETDEYCGGYCDYLNKEIAINYDENLTDKLIPTALHEICHLLQANVGVFDSSGDLISDEIKIEQQCETMAYILHSKLFNNFDKKIFDAYFEKSDVEFLIDWYGDYRQNDLIL